ncbi:hypothetical protein P691DRAFT_775582 [Macrolepiota fuliginosa MF-IS2]|uniref:Uncharacterized protein n=1 Tax=Macrolepiota fuliginosa MF-IS2 TaxID=1400762 RepID=A0A9P5XBY0_9AGAR|nr:hypothetical protein P691DRAFT_775582 [Macrolepiota fuliginosa MF-IS2]
MGRSEFNWRGFVRHIFRTRTTDDQVEVPASTAPVKASPKLLKPSRSISIFRNLSLRSRRNNKDDTSSFMSPMPRELRSTSSEDTELSSPLGFECPEDWNDSDKTDSIRLSFIQCGRIIDTFPEPPTAFVSCAVPSRRFKRPRIPSALLQPSYGDPADQTNSSKRILKQVHGRTPTPFPQHIHHGLLQYSTTSIPSDLLSRTDQLNRSNSFMDSRKLLRSPSRESLGSSASPQSSPGPSPAHSYTPEVEPIFSWSTASSRRLSTSISLQDLRCTSPIPSSMNSSFSSPFLPSSFRLPMPHVPGLEHRVTKPSFSAFIPSDGTTNVSGAHVPYGTLRF